MSSFQLEGRWPSRLTRRILLRCIHETVIAESQARLGVPPSAETIVLSFPGSQMSSASRKARYSLVERRTPAFRAALRPPLR